MLNNTTRIQSEKLKMGGTLQKNSPSSSTSNKGEDGWEKEPLG